MNPSEDRSHLLKPPAVAAHEFDLDEPRDYRPDERVDWIIDVEFEGSPVLQRGRILEVFDTAWWEANGRPDIYGLSPEIEHWTIPNAVGVPETYSKLAFGWSLFDPLNTNTFKLSADDLNRHKRSLADHLKKLGQPVLRESSSPDEAERRVKQIAVLASECDRDVTVVLAVPNGKEYEGRDIWDVMLCLGLQYGDMDLFHWHNLSGVGEDFFFSVWTSTPPGYFEPKWITAGKGNVDDLVFGYSIPRSADPLDVFETMMKAVRYAQERLGGSIMDESGKPFDEQAVRNEIEHVVRKLKEAGFAPGDHATCRVL